MNAQAHDTPAAKVKGGRHLLAAASYSLAGFRRLARETAFRHEIAGAFILIGALVATGAPVASVLVQGALLLILFACEALNTAIELIVDRVSPELSTFAEQAKDLGSFAVFALLVANAVYAASVLWPLVRFD